MSKKKQQKNGFFIFMMDMQQELRESGRSVPMRDMPVLAGPNWSKLTDGQKMAYNQRAKQGKVGKMPGAVGPGQSLATPLPRPGKMDSQGVLLSERRDLAAEMQERRRRERELLKASLLPEMEVTLQSFYFVDFQSLCEIPDKECHRFLPCEMAVVEYTIKNGIQRTLHKFIDPGGIPTGYRYQAKSHSECTHEIPIEGFEYAEKDYRMILRELELFVEPSDGRDFPPVFSKREYAERTEWCLQWLANKAGVTNSLRRVYEVEALLCELAAHMDGRGPTFFQAVDYLKTSSFDHTQATRCLWHEQRENKNCSLGCCKIYCFVISDAVCQKYGVSMTSQHLPRCSDVRPALFGPAASGQSTPSGYFSGSEASAHERMGPPNPGLGRGRGRGRGVVWAGGPVRRPMVGGVRLEERGEEEGQNHF